MGIRDKARRALLKCPTCAGTGREGAYIQAAEVLDRQGRSVDHMRASMTAYKRCTGCGGSGVRR